jgi:cyclopropane-fatty-acyl-phospholipid synthase
MLTTSMLKAFGRLLRPRFEKQLLSMWTTTSVEVEYWDGRRVTAGDGSPAARIEITCPSAVAEMAISPSLGFGNAYSDGRLRVHGDLGAVLDVAFAADPSQGPLRASRLYHGLRQAALRLLPRRDVNNARYHYDQGNEFFGLWLDPTMTYSCAYFRNADDSLETAQRQKIELLCRKLDLRPGQTLLDVGCGWGGLLFHAIEKYDVNGVGVTPSLEQARHIEQEARRRGIRDRVTLHVSDWRQVTGVYDRIVSVGMYEHVGKSAGKHFLRQWRRWLKPGGVSVLHTIGSMQCLPPDPWIVRNIFPGGYLPSLGELADHAAAAGLQIADVENLWRHYAMTLDCWTRNFDDVRASVEQSAGVQFARTWWLYLNGSKSAFRTGRCQLWQLIITSDKKAPQPLTREPWLLKPSVRPPSYATGRSG